MPGFETGKRRTTSCTTSRTVGCYERRVCALTVVTVCGPCAVRSQNQVDQTLRCRWAKPARSPDWGGHSDRSSPLQSLPVPAGVSVGETGFEPATTRPASRRNGGEAAMRRAWPAAPAAGVERLRPRAREARAGAHAVQSRSPACRGGQRSFAGPSHRNPRGIHDWSGRVTISNRCPSLWASQSGRQERPS